MMQVGAEICLYWPEKGTLKGLFVGTYLKVYVSH